jgi:hypothetical protein
MNNTNTLELIFNTIKSKATNILSIHIATKSINQNLFFSVTNLLDSPFDLPIKAKHMLIEVIPKPNIVNNKVNGKLEITNGTSGLTFISPTVVAIKTTNDGTTEKTYLHLCPSILSISTSSV